jgi:hypothetical protein
VLSSSKHEIGLGNSPLILDISKKSIESGLNHSTNYPAHAVEVVVHEIPKSHWGVAGEPASERLKDESVPKESDALVEI